MDKLEYIPGDLVMIEMELIKPRIVKVSKVDVDNVIYCEDWGDVWFHDEIKPIPLTPEILEKNGWKKGGYGFYIKDNFPFLIYKDVDSFNVKIDEFKEDTFIKLSYCHQLQHLFFGLGINHEMEVQV